MKRIILVIALVSVILAGFSLDGIIEYSYRQSADQIESIEILRYVRNDSVQVGAPMYVVKAFKPDEFQMVLDELNYLPVMNTLRSPGRGFGVYVICITYKMEKQIFWGTVIPAILRRTEKYIRNATLLSVNPVMVLPARLWVKKLPITHSDDVSETVCDNYIIHQQLPPFTIASATPRTIIVSGIPFCV